MKKTNLTLAALLVSIAAASFAVTGCGKNEKAEETTASETLETSSGYEDNFAVDSRAAAEFAEFAVLLSESEPQPVSAAVPMHITAIRVQSIFFVFIILLSFLMCCRLYS